MQPSAGPQPLYGNAPIFGMRGTFQCSRTCVQNDMYTISSRAPHPGSADDKAATMCTNVRMSMTTLDYQADESGTTESYYQPVLCKVREDPKLPCQQSLFRRLSRILVNAMPCQDKGSTAVTVYGCL